jgi:hypothetical protein
VGEWVVPSIVRIEAARRDSLRMVGSMALSLAVFQTPGIMAEEAPMVFAALHQHMTHYVENRQLLSTSPLVYLIDVGLSVRGSHGGAAGGLVRSDCPHHGCYP